MESVWAILVVRGECKTGKRSAPPFLLGPREARTIPGNRPVQILPDIVQRDPARHECMIRDMDITGE